MNALRFLYEGFSAVLFPNKCIGCGEIIPEGESLCSYCFEMLPATAVDNRCRACGLVKKDCQCKYRVFYFSGTTAPYYNEGAIKHAMHVFKFRKRLYYADFFARQMALSVKTDFYGIRFTAIAYVPIPFSRELKRGYNQSRELALRLSKILDIPLVENALGCNNKRKIQHETNYKDRFKNVRGAYYPNVSLKNRRVLLVDDIKTSGATLNECSRSLLKAGADEVYCVTGLITRKKKRGKENGNRHRN